MGCNQLSKNKYKVTVELGYDVLGNRRRKTEIVNGTLSEARMKEAELRNKY